MPKIACASSLRPEPTRPARPTISPARSVRLTPLVRRPAARGRATSRTGSPIVASSFGNRLVDRAADHHLDQVVVAGLGDRAGRDVGAVAQHGDPVGEHEDLLEAMADVDDADAARRAAAGRCRTAARRRASVSAAVGSSMIRMRAFCESALAISTRCRLPTESAPTTRADVEVVDVERGEQLARPARASPASRSRRSASRGAWPMKMFSATVSSGNSSSSW